MRRLALLCTFAFLGTIVLAEARETRPLLAGFFGDQGTEQQWETRFSALPSPQEMRENMKLLAAEPHHLGSPYDAKNARWILSKFREWGWDAHIETFDVLFPTPKERLVEMVEPSKFTATLREPPIPGDPTSAQQKEQLPTYNAYSIDGDVTAPLVYVNYGVPADYEQLERFGVSVKGAIVIARYGKSWRGVKPQVAAEHGAIGCLIYSDPRDDGYFEGDVYPNGPWRPDEGVQRGSVMVMQLYPGDPLTPGVGATKDAKRLPLKDVKVLTKIPVLPLSYGDALPLLKALGGPVAPEGWRGALPITYHIGLGPAKVHLVVKSNWDLKTVRDIIAKIPGSAFPDEWVIRGNHYDAWVNGADDPISGQVALLAEAHSLGQLVKQGWRPKRTILYCAWDGEEPGLLGSTEWAEEHAAELEKHAVAYINSDSNSRGYLFVAGSHTLETLMNGVAKDVLDPEKGISVWNRGQLRRIREAATDKEREELRSQTNLRIGDLGSGSDYSVFIDHLGIATLNLGFGGEGDGGGVYHSIYDDFYWYSHFDDTDEVYGRALAQTAGTAVMRLADADLLPLDFSGLTAAVHLYVSEIQKFASDQRDEIKERNKEIDEGVFTATSDPRKTYIPPAKEEVPPYLNFAPLENALLALGRSAQRYHKALTNSQSSGSAAFSEATLTHLNQDLIAAERGVMNPAGLPGRPWYKNELYAPGFYTGYGVKTIPAVREAIEQKHWEEANTEMVTVGKVLEGEAAAIDAAAADLEKATR